MTSQPLRLHRFWHLILAPSCSHTTAHLIKIVKKRIHQRRCQDCLYRLKRLLFTGKHECDRHTFPFLLAAELSCNRVKRFLRARMYSPSAAGSGHHIFHELRNHIPARLNGRGIYCISVFVGSSFLVMADRLVACIQAHKWLLHGSDFFSRPVSLS